MKAYMDKDEWWPVYSITDSSDYFRVMDEVDVPEQLIQEYRDALKVFSETQGKLIKVWQEQVKLKGTL